MFKFTKAKLGLTNSQLFDEHGFFSSMSTDIKNARRSVIIESPFVTARRATEIAPLFRKVNKKGVTVEIRTRDPLHHDENLRKQSVQGIKLLKIAGASVQTHTDMRHMKTAIVDGHILWEGSLNMLSHSNSREIMRRTVSEELSREMLQWLR